MTGSVGMADMLQPRDETDPFCTCPSCELLGTHAVEVIVWEERWVPGHNGERVVISRLEDPPDGTRRARRSCVFCGHVWHTHAEQKATEA